MSCRWASAVRSPGVVTVSGTKLVDDCPAWARLMESFRTRDGWVLEYLELGDPNGQPATLMRWSAHPTASGYLPGCLPGSSPSTPSADHGEVCFGRADRLFAALK